MPLLIVCSNVFSVTLMVMTDESRLVGKGFAWYRCTMATDDDLTLIAAARTGDRRAIDELLARYEQQIYRYGLRMCGDEDSAREILQETMLAAFRHLPTFRGEAA